MPVRVTGPGEQIDVAPGQAAIWIRSQGSAGAALACLRTVDRFTDGRVPVLLSDPAIDALALKDAAAMHRDVLHLPGADPVALTAPADVVLIAVPCEVAEGWLEALASAAYCDTIVASASALATGDIGLAPPLKQERFHALAAELRRDALRSRPRLELPLPGCVYVRRDAIALAGPLDHGFWARCAQAGLSHVLADEVLVNALGAEAREETEPLRRALAPARRAVRGLSVLIDARLGEGQATGTLVQISGLVNALARAEHAHVRVLVDEPARAVLPCDSEIMLVDEAGAMDFRADLVHRPLQVFRDAEIAMLPRLADRVVLTNLDLIGYRNPSYFVSPEDWRGFRRRTRYALALADHVVFPSAHARADALADDLVSADRSTVVPLGLDHGPAPPPEMPIALPASAAGGELIVCLGADYRHKNRAFALRVVTALQREHDWPGWLVLAGPHMPVGSSAEQEAELLATDPRLAGRTVDVGPVTEAEKEWLYQHASLVIYPTVYEGFGLVPFEAGSHQVPCLWANTTSLAELLGRGAGQITMWETGATALCALELMRNRAAAQRNVDVTLAAAAELTWKQAAARMLELYAFTCDQPCGPAAALARVAPEHSLSEDALRLLGPGRLLPAEVERPLLALATHPALGRPVFGALRAGYRLGRTVTRLRRPSRN